MGLYSFDLQPLLPPFRCWKQSMHLSPRLYESLAICILLFPLKCHYKLSLQIVIVKMIELLILIKLICCGSIVGKWSRIFVCCKSIFCDNQFFLYSQWSIWLSHGILGIGLVKLARQISRILVICLYVQPKMQKLTIDWISTCFQSLAYNHEVNRLMCVA